MSAVEAPVMQVTGVRWISLADLLAKYVPGSQEQPWTWDDEAAALHAFPGLCGLQCPDTCPPDAHPGIYQKDLEDHLRRRGRIEQPVCLGADGRVWDGHHRIVAAIRLGFPGVPVEDLSGQPVDRLTGSPCSHSPDTACMGCGPDDVVAGSMPPYGRVG